MAEVGGIASATRLREGRPSVEWAGCQSSHLLLGTLSLEEVCELGCPGPRWLGCGVRVEEGDL